MGNESPSTSLPLPQPSVSLFLPLFLLLLRVLKSYLLPPREKVFKGLKKKLQYSHGTFQCEVKVSEPFPHDLLEKCTLVIRNQHKYFLLMLKLKVFNYGHYFHSNDLHFHFWTCGQDLSYVFSGMVPECGKNSYFPVIVWSVFSQARNTCPENSKSNFVVKRHLNVIKDRQPQENQIKNKKPTQNYLETKT